MAKVIELARMMAGLDALVANNDTSMDPGNTRLLEAMNAAKTLAIIFVPAELQDATLVASVASGTSMTGKVIGYTSAVDLTGTPFPTVTVDDALVTQYGEMNDGYAWWHIRNSAGSGFQIWTNSAGTAWAIGIPEPSDITTSTESSTGYLGWIHNFCATFGALSICLWNRNLELASIHMASLSRMMSTGQVKANDTQKMAWPLGLKAVASRGGA